MLEEEDFGLSKNPNRIRIWILRLLLTQQKPGISFLNLSQITQAKGLLAGMK